MKVRCIQILDESGNPAERSGWARLGAVYHVLGIWIEPEQTRLRLIGEQPTPALYQPEMFDVVSTIIPVTWVITSPKRGYFSLGPSAWSRAGFWEEYFDGDAEARACFEEERKKIVASDP